MLGVLSDWLRHLARRRRWAPNLASGRRGEDLAHRFLRRSGYVIVARAWHSSRAPGDLDLIAWSPSSQGDTLCFIEVKTRTTREVAPAHFAVDSSKRRVLRRLARHYMRQLPNKDVPTRFDILSIYFEHDKPPAFEHFPGAFGWAEVER